MLRIVIGRSLQSEYHLADASVCETHAVLMLVGEDDYELTDQGSRAGTFVRVEAGWQAVTRARVGPEDRLRFGAVEASVAEIVMHAARLAQSGPGRIRIGEGAVSAPPAPAQEEDAAELQRVRAPRRNPLTGRIEEGS